MFVIAFENCQLPTAGSYRPLVSCTNTHMHLNEVPTKCNHTAFARCLAGLTVCQPG